MSLPRPSRAQFLYGAAFALFLLLSGLATWFHEPWSDELQAWLIARDLSLPAIWDIMAVEGHFMLWHLCLAPLAKGGLPPESMCWFAWALNAFTGWMILYRTRLPGWCRALMLFSAPMLYFYACTARPYVLLPPLLLLLLQVHPSRDNRPFLYGILIALVAQIHIFCEGIAAALFLEWAWSQRNDLKRRRALALLLPPFSALLAFLQVVGAFQRSSWTTQMPTHAKSFSIIQSFIFQVSEMAEFWLGTPLWTGACVLIILAAFTAVLIVRQGRPAGLIWSIGALWMFGCSIFLWTWYPQRTALLLYLAVFSAALAATPASIPGKQPRFILLLLALLIVSTYWLGTKWLLLDLQRPAAGFQQTGRFLRQHFPPGQIVICYPDLCTQASAYAPDLEFYTMQNGARRTYYDASKEAMRLPQVSVNELLPLILERDCPLILNRTKAEQFVDRFPASFPMLRLECLQPFQNTLYKPDDLCVLVVRRATSDAPRKGGP